MDILQVQRRRVQTARAARQQERAELQADLAALNAFDAAVDAQILKEMGSGDMGSFAGTVGEQ